MTRHERRSQHWVPFFDEQIKVTHSPLASVACWSFVHEPCRQSKSFVQQLPSAIVANAQSLKDTKIICIGFEFII